MLRPEVLRQDVGCVCEPSAPQQFLFVGAECVRLIGVKSPWLCHGGEGALRKPPEKDRLIGVKSPWLCHGDEGALRKPPEMTEKDRLRGGFLCSF